MSTKEINLKSLAQTAGRQPAGRAEIAPGQAQIVNRKSEIVNPTLSLCMIVKNEEKFLPGCLESVKGYLDEIIIVDTGSTDNTVEIAKRFGAKVYHHAWENSFSKARNYSLDYATCDWIFILDADEELDKDDAHKLKEVIKNNSINVAYLPVFGRPEGGEISSVGNSERLFRNHSGFYYDGIVHNTLKCNNSMKKISKRFNIKLYHYGYCQDNEQMERKFMRTSVLLKEAIKNNPDDPNPHFYLASSYLERKKFNECIEESLEAIRLFKNQYSDIQARLLPYYTASIAFLNTDDMDNAEKYALEAIDFYPDYLDIYHILSSIYYNRREYNKCIDVTKKFLSILKTIETDPSTALAIPHITLQDAWLAYSRMAIIYYEWDNEYEAKNALESAINSTDEKWKPYIMIGSHFVEKSDFGKAEEVLKEGLKENPGNKEILYSIAEMFKTCGNTDMSINNLRKILEYYPDEISAKYKLGLILSKVNQFEEATGLFKAVINKDPKHIGALFSLGIAYEKTRNYRKAMGVYKRILKIEPENPEALVKLGFIYLNESNLTKAKECFLNTIKVDKYLLEAYLALSKIYICLNDLEGCVNSCDKLMANLDLPRDFTIDTMSDLSNLYISIGTTLREQQKEPLARFSFEIATLLVSNSQSN